MGYYSYRAEPPGIWQGKGPNIWGLFLLILPISWNDFIGVGNILNGDDMYEEYDEDNYTYCCFVWDKEINWRKYFKYARDFRYIKNYIIKGLLTDSADGFKIANDSLD